MENLFHPLYDDDTTYPNMGDSKTDVANRPDDKKNKPAKSREGDCDSSNSPMNADPKASW